MQANIYSDILGEILHKKDIGTRVYIYNEHASRYTPSLILDNTLAVEHMIEFLQECLKEMRKNHGN